jgi:hypothetical protein
MPLSQTEYLWSGATPLLLISPARFFLYKGPKIDYFLRPPLDYRLLFALVSLSALPPPPPYVLVVPLWLTDCVCSCPIGRRRDYLQLGAEHLSDLPTWRTYFLARLHPSGRPGAGLE